MTTGEFGKRINTTETTSNQEVEYPLGYFDAQVRFALKWSEISEEPLAQVLQYKTALYRVFGRLMQFQLNSTPTIYNNLIISTPLHLIPKMTVNILVISPLIIIPPIQKPEKKIALRYILSTRIEVTAAVWIPSTFNRDELI
jgi:hypothetical protein